MGRPPAPGGLTPSRIKVEAAMRQLGADWVAAEQVEKLAGSNKTSVSRFLRDMVDRREVERKVSYASSTWNGWGTKPRGMFKKYLYRVRVPAVPSERNNPSGIQKTHIPATQPDGEAQ